MSTEGLGVHKTLTFPIIYKWICSQRILLELEYLKLTLYVKHSTPSTPPISSSCMRHKQEDFLSTGWVNIALWDIHKLSWQNYAEYWPLPPPFVDKFTKISLCIVFDILWTPSFPHAYQRSLWMPPVQLAWIKVQRGNWWVSMSCYEYAESALTTLKTHLWNFRHIISDDVESYSKKFPRILPLILLNKR